MSDSTKVQSVLTFLLLALLTAAQAGAPRLEVVSPGDGSHLTRHVVLVVDCSGSMIASHPMAVALAVQHASPPTDQPPAIHCVAFGDVATVWPGGWAKMPDGEKLAQLAGWLTFQRPTSGGVQTFLAPALKKAFALHKDASVIVVSDGEVYDTSVVPPGRIAALIETPGGAVAAEQWGELSKLCAAGHYRVAK